MLKPGRPRHEQISDWLREQIQEGVYEDDDRLPSESELGERFDVSRITVRRALQTLESEGLLYRRQGLGSFVQDRRVHQPLVRLTDFVEDMEQAGITATSRLLEMTHEPAGVDVARRLEVEEGQTVVRVERRRMGDDRPIAFDRTWLPVFYGHLLEGHDLDVDSIYHVLEREYDIPVLRGRYFIEAVNADPHVARHLEVSDGAALLLIERTSYTTGDKAMYFQRRYYRSDRVAYELELERTQSGAPHRHGMPLREFEPVFKGRK